MKKFTQFLIAMLFIATSTMYGQTITGTVLDDINEPLPGADVILIGTTTGISTDFNGVFSLNVEAGSGSITISFIGYNSKTVEFTIGAGETLDLGNIALEASQESLDEIVIVGIADIIKDRQTPVAVSTIKASEIQDRLGSQELPELLNSMPSVYATKSGGGFGDSRINIRGFDQRNTAVLINGVPVNDMENGWVYWSNWAGLADVTSAIQVQRGLGSSKLAVSSVGGTINVLTKTSDAKQGGSFATTVGNDGYFKILGSYNTGKLDNGLSVSLLLSQTQGNGYNEGTKFQGNNYFIALGYEINEKHNLQFTYTGAPQWHHQHSRSIEIYKYQQYGGSEEYPNRRFNDAWGYKDGEEYSFRRNFYHKPVMTINWDWALSDASSISTAAYASWGRGGGSGPIGNVDGIRDFDYRLRDENGHVRFDDIVTWNSGGTGHGLPVDDRTGDLVNNRGDGMTRRASMNSHNWYGMISNFNHKFNENLTFDFGVDLRTYTGVHYRVVNDDLGASGYTDNRDSNNPNRTITEYYSVTPSWNPFVNIKDQQKIEYYNDGNVGWLGAFTQLEYKTDRISTFIQAAISQQSFQRVEYFNESPENQTSPKEKILGGNVKAGINFKIDTANNIFFNTGYYSKQPLFDAVWINFGNNLNPDLQNEKIFGLELGYGYHAENFNVKVNLYRTSWKDRFETVNATGPAPDEIRGTANLYGINQVHTGIEFEANYRATKKLSFQGMLSIGNWEYDGNVQAQYFDEDRNPIPGLPDAELILDGIKVGDAAQTTARLGLTYEVIEGLRFDTSWSLASNLYADFEPTSVTEDGALKLPNYDLVDMGLSYRLPFNDDKQAINFRLNVNNVFDEVYIAESDTNYHPGDRGNDDLYKGINTSNRIYWGFGRTWNFTMRFEF